MTFEKISMMTSLRMLVILLSSVIFAGCASIIDGDRQYLTIEVTCKGNIYPSICVATNSKGSWLFNTPQKNYIYRDNSPLRIKCESGFLGSYEYTQNSIINTSVAGNIVAGGVLGVIYDVNNNSFWDYPKYIKIESEFCKRLPN